MAEHESVWQRLKGRGWEAYQKTNKQTRANSDGSVDRKRGVKYENAEELKRYKNRLQVLLKQGLGKTTIYDSIHLLKCWDIGKITRKQKDLIHIRTYLYIFVCLEISHWQSHRLWAMEKLYLRKNFLNVTFIYEGNQDGTNKSL